MAIFYEKLNDDEVHDLLFGSSLGRSSEDDVYYEFPVEA